VSDGLAGAVAWAVVPFVPEAPFRIYAGRDHDPLEVARPTKLISAARRGSDSEFTFLVPAKARPVLVVSDRADPRLRELLALRLLRLSALDAEEQDVVRRGADPGLFFLDPDQFKLPEENAAIIAALVRVHRGAIDARPAGRLEQRGLATLQERIVRHYRFDMRQLVRTELERLADAQRRRSR
jgi:hypothetical protein